MKRKALVLPIAIPLILAASIAYAADQVVRLTRSPTGEVGPGEMFELE